MDFKSFRNQRKQNENHKEEPTDDLRKKAESYSRKSDDELLDEIIKNVNQGKANGTFSEEQLRQFEQNVAPMLNAEQRERLRNVIEIIRKN